MSSLRISKQYNGEAIFLTLTTIEWINIFTDKQYFDVLLNSLKYCQAKKGLLIYGYVFMTNHIHLILSSTTNNLDNIIRDFKHFTTLAIKKLLEIDRRQYISKLIFTSFSKKKDQEFQIWQRENYPEVIFSQEFFQQKLTYIHNNPVKKGYVIVPENWAYSSARNYYLKDDSLIILAGI